MSRYDVAIVGSGPTGVSLANLLGAQGVRVLLLDRLTEVLDIPRAVHLDGETMRVFQAMDLAEQVLGICRPGYGMHWVNAQNEILAIRQGQAGLSDQGWHNDYYFHQPQLERVLRTGLNRYLDVDMRLGYEAVACEERGDSCLLSLRRLADGTVEQVTASYVVGCDGARSIVRQWVGDEHEDLGLHQAWLVADVILKRPLDLPEHSVQHCDPARPATSIYIHPLRRRWEIMVMKDDDPESLSKPEFVWKLLERWVKPTQGVLERAAIYVFHSLVSTDWQRGRLFLAGDAAHQTPPFLGQGLCAGVRDAANLAWKLALAVQRPASRALLESYGPERRPHAREFVDLAVRMGHVIQVVDPVAAQARDTELRGKGWTFTFPRPALGPGVHMQEGGAAGKIFVQPILPDGRWLDDVVGPRFALVVNAGTALRLDQALRARLAALDVVLIEDAGPRAQAWFADHDCEAVLLRPDRYVFGTARHRADLDAGLAKLEHWLG